MNRERLMNWVCASRQNTIAKQSHRSYHPRHVFLALLLPLLICLFSPARVMGQVTATLSGIVADANGGVIPGAQVTLVNENTQDSRTVKTNEAGIYAFPSLVPGTYTIKATAKGFSGREVTGIDLHAGDSKTVAAFALAVGAETQTVTVQADEEMIPTDNGQRTAVLASEDIENLALIGRDTTELMKVLPGATTVAGGLTNSAPAYNDLNVGVQQSAIGNGVNINGAVNRGGTALLADGANIIDPGNMASSVAIVNPEMTAEVNVQASNFGADVPFGPVVVSTISKSGSDHFHGEGYFDARNSILNANDWQDNHTKTPRQEQHYYYPGGNLGGPVPGTHKKLMFWGGYERFLQAQPNVLKSTIPSASMMKGDFTTTNADNQKLCPNGFFNTPTSSYPQGSWCADLGGDLFPDGSSAADSKTLAAYGTAGGDVGQRVPAQFLDPGAAALAKIWPAANADPASTGGFNYYQPINNVNNGWVYRLRLDYQLKDNTKIYGSYQQAFNSQLANGNGAHLYWTPGNAIPFPGGNEVENFYGKSMSGHLVHTFNSTTTMDFMAAWAWGSFPFVQPSPSAIYKETLGYTYGKIFKTSSHNIPAYSSAGGQSFPDFSQASIFDNPPGQYAVKKAAPQFNLTITKVWGTHTFKMGGFTQTTDNFQSTFATNQDGAASPRAGQNPDLTTGIKMGSGHNATAAFVQGILTAYSENNSSPIDDTAYMATAGFLDDTWKATRKMTLELGGRVEHIGHWYDRQGTGMAVFYPLRVQADYNSGKYAPGYYWHAIDAGVPLSGQPNRFAYFNPRFGVSYDVRGNGSTVVRGGWGAYRFVTQVNDVDPPLVTAQHVLGYSQPGSSTMRLSEIAQQPLSKCQSLGCSTTQAGFDPTDYGQPLTFAYNLTIDQRLKWNTQFEIAYVGSSTSQLTDNGEGIEGSNYAALADQNKTPLGAFFQPDPQTGVLSTNPENLGTNLDGTKTGNSAAHYHPYGTVYGTNAMYMDQNNAYTNYNGLQVVWAKTSGRLTFNLNGTWSKTLGTALQENPYDVNKNYGPTSNDRPLVFNSSYTYQTGTLHLANRALNQLGSGWSISGISTWQAGGYIPAALGNGVPNFSMSLNYSAASLPANAKAAGIGQGIGAATYFGTDSGIPILPVLTCNPTKGLAHYQLLSGKCFNAPAFQTQGGQAFPYMKGPAYFNNDLAIFRTFRIHENQNVEFKASASDWTNHPLPQFSNLNLLQIQYLIDYNSHAITPNFNQGSTVANKVNPFGVMDFKTGAPYGRIINLDVKYTF